MALAFWYISFSGPSGLHLSLRWYFLRFPGETKSKWNVTCLIKEPEPSCQLVSWSIAKGHLKTRKYFRKTHPKSSSANCIKGEVFYHFLRFVFGQHHFKSTFHNKIISITSHCYKVPLKKWEIEKLKDLKICLSLLKR